MKTPFFLIESYDEGDAELSWWKTNISTIGMEKEDVEALVKKCESIVAGIKTEAEKQDALEDIQKAIDKTPTSGKIVWQDVVEFALIGGHLIWLLRMVLSHTGKGKKNNKLLIELLKKLKSKIEKKKVKKS